MTDPSDQRQPPESPIPEPDPQAASEAGVLDPYHADRQPEEPRPPKPLWKRALGWSKWLISAGLLAFVIWQLENPKEILATIRNADPLYILAAFALIPLGVVIGAFRWKWLLAANDVRPSLGFLIGSGCVAAFVRLALPSTIGGDAVRVYDSWRAGATKSVALATIGVDRLLGLFALVIMASVAMTFNSAISDLPMVRWIALAVGLGMFVVLAWIFVIGKPPPAPIMALWNLGPTPVRRPFEKLFRALGTFHGQHATLVKVFLGGVVLQLNVIAFYWLIALGLGIDITFLQMLAAAPIAVFVMLIPITINGIGLREAVWATLLGAYGFEKANGVALGAIELGLFVAFGLLGGLVYAARK